MTDIGAINGYTSSTLYSDTGSAEKTLSADMNTFLKLLTTQLKYQDPLDPTDTSEFTSQLVQYSSVEQAIQTNTKLDALIALNNNNLGAQAVSYIGKIAQVQGDVMPLDGGKAQATYTFDKDVESCTIMVKNGKGDVVFTQAGEPVAGTHTFKWDGKDSDGNQLEDGAYQIVVNTVSAPGDVPASVITTVFGRVSGVASDSGGVYVGLGDSVTANLSDILTVRETDFLKNDSVAEAKDKTSSPDNGEIANEKSTASIVDDVLDTLKDAAGVAAMVL